MYRRTTTDPAQSRRQSSSSPYDGSGSVSVESAEELSPSPHGSFIFSADHHVHDDRASGASASASGRHYSREGGGRNGGLRTLGGTLSQVVMFSMLFLLTMDRIFFLRLPRLSSYYHDEDDNNNYYSKIMSHSYNHPKSRTTFWSSQESSKQIPELLSDAHESSFQQHDDCPCRSQTRSDGDNHNADEELYPSSSSFQTITVFRNPQTANSEIPPRNSIRTKLGASSVTNPYSQAWQDYIIVALTKANDEATADVEERNRGLSKSTRTTKNDNDNGNVPSPRGQDKERPILEHTNVKFFVDLAANHPIQLSNTLYLEQQGWKGICIEGNSDYWYDLARYRTCQIIGAFVGGSRQQDGQRAVQIALRSFLTGIVSHDTDNTNATTTAPTVTRELVSLDTVLLQSRAPKVIDYLSLDVEGAESLVLQDFSFDRYVFRFLTIERPKDDLKQLLHKHGYVMCHQLTSWGETLWMHEGSVQLNISQVQTIVQDVILQKK